MYKYFVSISAVFKNEPCFFIEWIEHYLVQGIEHFYLVDNGNTNNYIQQIQSYIERGIVDLFIDPEDMRRTELYNKHIFPKAKNETRWIANIGLNEFAYAQHDNSIFDVLKKEVYVDITQLICPVITFDSDVDNQNNMLSSKFVSLVEKIIKRREYINMSKVEIRLIERTNKSVTFSGQQLNISEDTISTFDILVNHYLIKSLEPLPETNYPEQCDNNKIIICSVKYNNVSKNIIEDLKLYKKKQKYNY